MQTQHFHSPRGCLSYLTYDPASKKAALIDPSAEIGLSAYTNALDQEGLKLVYVIETHTHADHISIAREVQEVTGATLVRHELAPSPHKDVPVTGGEELELGEARLKILATPGHTNESISLYNGTELFTGDALLIGGTGRTDFQVGDSETLYHTLHHVIGALPVETVVRPGHDYRGRNSATLGDELHTNPRILMCESEFVSLMDAYHPPKPELFDIAIPKNSE
jgi:glyoxylase-like metal-dependent hydrolase (beta-lactamase superfamily II)